jgi:E3 ubiquitin-protein ligase RNF115/126
MDFEKNEEITLLPCQHYFHSLCVRKWLQLHDACPLCRKSIQPPKINNNTNTNEHETTTTTATHSTPSEDSSGTARNED